MSDSRSLKLTRIHLARLPGMQADFTVEAEPGVNLILGPNESGKSSLARAARLLLWSGESAPESFEVSADFSQGDKLLQVSRQGSYRGPWRSDGEDVPPPALPPSHLADCYRLGLLDLHRAAAGETENDLAADIRRQMAGGYALEPVAELFRDQSNRISRAREPFRQAADALRDQKFEHESLAEDESRLAGMRDHLATVERAASSRQQLNAARSLRHLALKITEIQAELATLPAAAAQVRDDDEALLAALTKRIAKTARQEAELRADIDARRTEIDTLDITGDVSALDPLLRRAEEAQVAVRQSARERQAATDAVAELARDLAPELLSGDDSPASVESIRRLVGLQADQARLGAAVKAQADLRQHLAAVDGVEMPSSPDATLPLGDPSPPAKTALALGGLFVLGGAILFVLHQRAIAAALGAAGLSLLVSDLVSRRERRAIRQRMEEYGRAMGHPLDAGWRAADFRQLIQTVQRQQGAAEGALATRNELTELAHQRQTAAERERDEFVAQRRALLAAHGQDLQRDTTDLAHEWDRLRLWREAVAKREQATAAFEHDAAQARDAIAAAADALRAAGESPGEALVDIQAGCRRIDERRGRCAVLREQQETDNKTLRAILSHLADAEAERERLLTRLQLPTRTESSGQVAAQLKAIAAARPRWSELSEQLAAVTAEHKRQEQLLSPETMSELLQLSDDELEERLAATEEQASSRDHFMQRITALETRLAMAREGDKLEEAQAALDREKDKLTDLLDSQRFALAGRLLLADVTQEHEADAQPAALREMNRLLGVFTRGAYRMKVLADDGPRFVALGDDNKRRELGELSDGTRAQLLLAARLAFLRGTESDLRLPLFLDEALTASDPERFQAVAAALGRLATETGRQVFYLTSNPGDVGIWRQALAEEGLAPPHLIELGVVRRLCAAASPAQLAASMADRVPAPDGNDAPGYAARLGVPRLDPHQDPLSVPIFYLCRNNLDLVQRLYKAGITTYGRWQRLGPELVAAKHFQTSEAERISSRGKAYAHFARLWRTGRGRPLTAAALQASGVISDKFFGPACALMDEVAADAKAFLTEVFDGRLPHYRQDYKKALQEYLERESFLDSRDPLSRDDLVARMLIVPNLGLDISEVRDFVTELLAAADSA